LAKHPLKCVLYIIEDNLILTRGRSMLLVKPVLKCDLNCDYCYEHQEGLLESDKSNVETDIELMKESIEKHHERFGNRDGITIHGGEPLLLPIDELEELIRFSNEILDKNDLGKKVGIQTNGNLITDEHVELFKKHDVGVGISLDGFGDLNDLRGYPDVERTKEYTNRLEDTLKKLVDAGVRPGFISVLHQGNVGTDEKLDKFLNFLRRLEEEFDITGGRLNLAFIDGDTPEIELSRERAAIVYERLAEYVLSSPRRRYNPFREFADNLMGYGLGCCTQTKCEPFKTPAGRVVLPDGDLSTCVKQVDEGGNPIPFDDNSFTGRHELLLQKDCQGCRFFKVCYGGCPGRARDNDYMRKDHYCKATFKTYAYITERMQSMFPHIDLVVDEPIRIEDEHKDYRNRSGRNSKHNPFKRMHAQRSLFDSSKLNR
jgi:uncharacterized protein